MVCGIINVCVIVMSAMSVRLPTAWWKAREKERGRERERERKRERERVRERESMHTKRGAD